VLGRWPRCFSVTERRGYAPSSRPAAAGPAAFHYSARPFLFMRWVLGRGRFNDLHDKAFLLRTLARVVVRRRGGRNAASDRGNGVAKFHFAIGREVDEHADAMTVWQLLGSGATQSFCCRDNLIGHAIQSA